MLLIGRNLAVGLTAGLLIGAALTYALAGPPTSRTLTATSVATSTLTTTSVTTQDITITTTQGSASNFSSIETTQAVTNYSSIGTIQGYGSALFDIDQYGSNVYYASNGVWNFSVALSGEDVGAGIQAYVKLTNISNQTQNIRMANPLINPTLYCTYGPACTYVNPPPTLPPVWSWDPPNVTLVNVTVPPGSWYFSGYYTIQDRQLPQSDYKLSIWPLVEPSGTVGGGFSIGQSLMINATLGQSLEVSVPISVS